MYDRFKDLGVPVKMTRTTDETLSPTERVNRVLDAYGNTNDVIVISNHINAGGGDGAEVIYALRNPNTLANLILDEIGKEGQNIRKAYQRRLPSDTSKDYYFMQRNTGKTQPVTVEYGFLDSKGDDVAQLKNNYEDYAEAVVRAVMEYLNLPYSNASGSYYTVQSGDSLYSIARKYNTTVDAIKQLNNLSNNTLSIGQVLKIPTETAPIKPPSTNNSYTVQSGDSLYSIARKYNTTVDELMKLNNLTSNLLSIGQVLKVPTASTDIKPNYTTYIVQSGDSLYSIARKYNTTVDDIKQLNNLTNNLLSIGQELLIPTSTTSSKTYVVKSGDTLYSVARQFNTTVDEIKRKNNLANNLLSIGQTLKI